MIIDSFTHVIPASYLDKLASLPDEVIKKTAERALAFVKGRPHTTDPVRRLELLKKYGIDYQIVTLAHTLDCSVLPIPVEEQLGMAQAINDGMAMLMDQSKGKLLGIATAPVSVLARGGLKEMERAIKGLGLKGFCLPSNVWGKPLDAPEFAQFWDKAAELGAPVFIHPTHPVSQNDRTYETSYNMTMVFGWPFETVLALTRLVLSGVMERHPTLKVVNHHLGGGMIPLLWGRVEEFYIAETQQRELGRTLPRPVKEYFGRFYYDTAVGSHAPAIKCCCDTFGADQLLFSSDFPHGTAGEFRLESYPRAIRECGLPAKDVEKILGGNARKLLGIGR